ncbi:MAG: hypothetical protein J4203_05720 [Candidatus Diapherotrites archaeon]|uniref:CARDB domain-containing protein n=1 Tax=Candidatus Iainarchaeum sp. TaxID=3101447 RepID=A0A8T4LBK9_9ARCH|nr:hypothetical protein [Candidatus Diapherotrites archaeon]
MDKRLLVVSLAFLLIASTVSAGWLEDLFGWFNPTGEAAAAQKVTAKEISVVGANPTKAALSAPAVAATGSPLVVNCTGESTMRPPNSTLPFKVEIAVNGKEDAQFTVPQVYASGSTFTAQATLTGFTAASAGSTATITCTPKKIRQGSGVSFHKSTGKVQFRNVKPDFVVSAVDAPYLSGQKSANPLRLGEAFAVKVTVTNTSDAAYNGPLSVEVKVGSDPTQYINAVGSASLAASQGTFDFMVDAVAPAARPANVSSQEWSQQLVATVNPPGELAIDELKNDSKNSKTGSVRVGNVPLPGGVGQPPGSGAYDLEALVTHTPTTDAEGRQVLTFDFKVKNNGTPLNLDTFGGVYVRYFITGVPVSAVKVPVEQVSAARLRKPSGQTYGLTGYYGLQQALAQASDYATLFSIQVTRPTGNTAAISARMVIDPMGVTSGQDSSPANNEFTDAVAYNAPPVQDCTATNTCKVTQATATSPAVAASGAKTGVLQPVALTTTLKATTGQGQVMVVTVLERTNGILLSKQIGLVSLAANADTPFTASHYTTRRAGRATVRVWTLDGKHKLAERSQSFNLGGTEEDSDAT